MTTLEHTPERSLSVSLEPSEVDVVSLSLDDGAGPGVEGKSPRTVGEPERKPAHHSDYKNTAHGDTSLAAVLQPRKTRQFVTDDGGEPKRKGLTSKQWLLCVSALSFCWMLVTTFIADPMMFQRLKKSIPYERRKAMHYLSAVWGLSIMFHAPATNIFWVMGACVFLYLGDWLVGYFVGTFYCPTR